MYINYKIQVNANLIRSTVHTVIHTDRPVVVRYLPVSHYNTFDVLHAHNSRTDNDSTVWPQCVVCTRKTFILCGCEPSVNVVCINIIIAIAISMRIGSSSPCPKAISSGRTATGNDAKVPI